MDNPALLYVIAAAVAISAAAIVLQFIVLWCIYRSIREISARLTPVLARAETVLENASAQLAEIRQQAAEISSKTNQVLDSARAQMERIDGTLSEMTARARTQIERVELVLDDALDRIQNAVATVHNGVVKPVRQISGVVAGVTTAFQYFLKGGRPNVSEATMDEEMFI